MAHLVKVIDEKIQVAERQRMRLRGFRLRRGRRSREIDQGHDLHHRTGRWSLLHRLIDRRNDRYQERIVDAETGQVLQEVDEPLSAHRGHGSAKPTAGGPHP